MSKAVSPPAMGAHPPSPPPEDRRATSSGRAGAAAAPAAPAGPSYRRAGVQVEASAGCTTAAATTGSGDLSRQRGPPRPGTSGEASPCLDAGTDTDTTSLLICPFDVVYTDSPDGTDYVGRGRFSRVLRAVPAPAPAPVSTTPTPASAALAAPPSPPSSPKRLAAAPAPALSLAAGESSHPASRSRSQHLCRPGSGTVLAVKRPGSITSRVDRASLETEARILSFIAARGREARLQRLAAGEEEKEEQEEEEAQREHVVRFHGMLPAQCAVVLDYVGLSLEDLVLQRAQAQQQGDGDGDTGLAPTEPVIGERAWLGLAASLVAGLRWLHDTVGVVHGDIKPGNVLLRPRRDALRRSGPSRLPHPHPHPHPHAHAHSRRPSQTTTPAASPTASDSDDKSDCDAAAADAVDMAFPLQR
ncbi:hypothetical protein KEM52_002730 [Ascosphaera acerosa]|nr:hypothetical protein KEM52_002730 [Ascosphaera acerosa]